MTTTRTIIRTATSALATATLLLALAPAALASPPIEHGRDVFAWSDTITWLCGFPLERDGEFAGNWVLKHGEQGQPTSWQGTLNVTYLLTHPTTDRTATMRASGVTRELVLDDAMVTYAAGTGGFVTLPGMGVIFGVAGLGITVQENGSIVSAEFRGLETGDDERLCNYLAGA